MGSTYGGVEVSVINYQIESSICGVRALIDCSQ